MASPPAPFLPTLCQHLIALTLERCYLISRLDLSSFDSQEEGCRRVLVAEVTLPLPAVSPPHLLAPRAPAPPRLAFVAPSAWGWRGRLAQVPTWVQPRAFLTFWGRVPTAPRLCADPREMLRAHPKPFPGSGRELCAGPVYQSPCSTKPCSVGLSEVIWATHPPTICGFWARDLHLTQSPRRSQGWDPAVTKNPRARCLGAVSSLQGCRSTHLMCVELVTPAVRFLLGILCALEKCGQTLCRGNNNASR